MPERDEAPLLAVVLPAAEAAQTVGTAWDQGMAVAVLDPASPPHRLRRLITALGPTHYVDEEGQRALPGGTPVAAEVVAVVLTSGTAGEPKLVELTRSGLAASAGGVHRALGVGPGDRWLCCLPLHHVAGLAVVGRARSADLGFDVLTRFEVEEVAAAPVRLGSTLVSLVPTTLARLLDAQAPVGRFGAILLGGAPVPAELLQRASQRGARVVTTYGMSETWGGVIHDGRPLAGVEIRIADDGEILVRAPQVMRGYRSLEGRSAPSPFLADGWFRTGDAGEIDAEGRLAVIDRLSDLVVSGGVNVSPAEVERVLSAHPGVEEVCVSGRPDPEWGERVVAYVVPRDPLAPPSLEELQELARAELSSPAVPRELVLLYAVPRSPSGKALRRLLPQARG